MPAGVCESGGAGGGIEAGGGGSAAFVEGEEDQGLGVVDEGGGGSEVGGVAEALGDTDKVDEAVVVTDFVEISLVDTADVETSLGVKDIEFDGLSVCESAIEEEFELRALERGGDVDGLVERSRLAGGDEEGIPLEFATDSPAVLGIDEDGHPIWSEPGDEVGDSGAAHAGDDFDGVGFTGDGDEVGDVGVAGSSVELEGVVPDCGSARRERL